MQPYPDSILHNLSRDFALGSNFRHISARMPVISRDNDGAAPPNASILPYTYGLTGVNLPLDRRLQKLLYLSMLTVAFLILVARFVQMGNAHLRHLFSLSANRRQQNFWSVDRTSLWPNLKKHLLYAPLGKKRHNREVRMSEAVNVGTLPSRFHALMLSLYVFSNVLYCFILNYHQEKAALIAEIRGRTGALAVINMIPLIILAGRNNPLIPLLRVSFDTYNLLHRWMGRIVVLESIAHTIAWAVNSGDAKGSTGTAETLRSSPFLQYGLVGTCAMVFILLQSPSVVRHAFYETFLHLHQLAAFVTILGVYVHIDLGKLPQKPYIRLIVAIWVTERCIRWFRLIYLNLSRRRGSTKVVVEALPGEACRVTIFLPRGISIAPRSHVYAYLPSISWWMSHPFSVAWTELITTTTTFPTLPPTPTTPNSLEKQSAKFLPLSSNKTATTVSLIMSARTGMTRKLYSRASASTNSTYHTSGYLEGPYSGHDSLNSYGTVVLFAGGVGITHHLLTIRHLLASSRHGTVATRKIVLVWSVRTVEQLSWVRPWMDEILAMEGRREVLKIFLFVTKPKSPREVVSPSTTVQMYPGRCRPNVILDDEIPSRVGAMAVSVCGPGAFADEVRQAVRDRMHWGSLDFIEEAFSW